MKRGLGINVLDAARERIRAALDDAERAYVSFSGGKDSTVMLHLVMEEVIRRGEKIGVLFIDFEAQYQRTVGHIAACYEMYADHIDPHWVALPMNLRNAVSVYEPEWMCWDPDKEDSWVRQRHPLSVGDPGRYPFYEHRMEFEEFVPRFAEWYADGKSTAAFVGIRTQESLNRWRTVASQTKRKHEDWQWTTEVAGGAWNAYPLYDWQTEDIWTYHSRYPDLPCNEVYDLMHRAGLTIHQARLCQPYGDDQRKGLWLFHMLEPQTWGRVVARVNGANQGALYAQETGNILGQRKVTRPEGHTWESFAHLMLDSLPAPTSEHYRVKIGVFLDWWAARGYPDGIPDEADAQDEAKKRAPSWRRICKALLRNDYWCKGLSFSQHKDRSSYARYRAITANKSNQWASACGDGVGDPGRPTANQLALVAAMTGGCTPWQAWKVIGQRLGRSATSAQRHATRQEVSGVIQALKQTEAEYQQLKFRFRPDSQGDRSSGLPGEGTTT